MRLFIQPLDQTHRTLFEDFEAEDENVGRDSYKTYLKVNAEADQRKGNARTYLAIEENDEGKRTLVGFYSLRASSLIKDNGEYDDEKTGEPAIEIYQFAVKRERQRERFGKKLMQNIIGVAYELSQSIGVMYLLVCSVESSVGFYEKCHFKKLPGYDKHIPRNDSNSDCVGMYLNLQPK